MPKRSFPSARRRPVALAVASMLVALALGAAPGKLHALDSTMTRIYIGHGEWANPLAWFDPGEPSSDENLRIRTFNSVTYQPLLFPNSVYSSIAVGRDYLLTDPPPLNGFSVTPSLISDRGFYVDRGAGSFSPVLQVTNAALTLRTGTLDLGVGTQRQGALLISGGAVEVGSRLTVGSGDLLTAFGQEPGIGYIRLAAGGAGSPELRVGADLVLLGQRGGQGFIQQETGRIAVGGSFLMGLEPGSHGPNTAYMNLVGGTLSVAVDSVIGHAWDTSAGMRHGSARHEVVRDLIIGRGGIGDYETMAGSVLAVGRDLMLGHNAPRPGSGRVLHGAGTIEVARDLVIGSGWRGSGSVRLEGSAFLSVGGNIVVGMAAETVADLVVDGGGFKVIGNLTVGEGEDGVGSFAQGVLANRSRVLGDFIVGVNRGSGAALVQDLLVSGAIRIGDRGFGEVTLSAGGVLHAQSMEVGSGSGGPTYVQRSSSFSALSGGAARLAGDVRVTGSMLLDGAQLDVGNDFLIDNIAQYQGPTPRKVVVGGGSNVHISRDLVFGRERESLPQLELSGTGLAVVRDLVIGEAARNSYLNLRLSPGDGTLLTVAGRLVLGAQSGAGGSLTVAAVDPALPTLDGVSLRVSGSVLLGDAGLGSMSLSDGLTELVGPVTLGASSGGMGYLSLRDHGRLALSNSLVVGDAGEGQLNLWLGTATPHLNVTGQMSIGNGADNGRVVHQTGSIGAGSLVVGSRGRYHASGDSRLRTGQFTVDGGIVELPGSFLIASAPGDHGATALTLAGAAEFTVPRLQVGSGGLVVVDGLARLTAERIESSDGLVRLNGGELRSSVLQIDGAAGDSFQFIASGGSLVTGLLDIGSGGRVSLNGALHLGMAGPHHLADRLQLAQGAELEVPLLALGDNSVFEGHEGAVLRTQTIDVSGGGMIGTLRNTGVLRVSGGSFAGALLRNAGTIDLQANLQLGELVNTGQFDIGAGRQVEVGAGGSGRVTNTGVVGVAGSGSRLSATQFQLREASQLAISGGGLVEVTAGLSAGAPGTALAAILLDRGTLRVDGGPLTIGAEGPASLNATLSSIAVGSNGDQRLHIGNQGTASLVGGMLAPVGAESLLRVQVDAGGVLQMGGTQLNRVEAIDVAGRLIRNGRTGPVSTTGPQRTRVEITPGGHFVVDMGASNGSTGDYFYPEVVNLGTWRKVGDGSGDAPLTAVFAGPVAQGGTLVVEDGTLWLGGETTGTGVTRVASAGSLLLRPTYSTAGTAVHYDWSGTFNNDGSVGVASQAAGATASARFTSSGTHGGRFGVSGGATLVFAGGAHGFAKSAATNFFERAGIFAEGGTLEFTGGSFEFGVGSTLWTGSPLTVPPSRTHFLGGTIRLNAGSSIVLPDTFAIEGSDLMLSTGAFHNYGRDIALRSGSLGGSDLFVQTAGRFDWSGGRLYGPEGLRLNNPVTLSIAGAGFKQLDRRLVVNGAASWTGGDIAGQGTLVLSGFSSFTGTAPQVFDPAVEARGAFVSRVEDAGAALYRGRFDVLGGTVAVERGTLRLSGGGSSDAGLAVGSGTTLVFSGGEFVLDGANARIAGGGSASFEGGRVLLRNGARFGGLAAEHFMGGTLELGAGSVYSFNDGLRIEAGALLVSTGADGFTLPRGSVLQGGALGGGDVRTVAAGDTFTWSGGTLGGPGATTVAAHAGFQIGGKLVIAGADTKVLGADLLNAGSARWQGGNIGGTATFVNAAGASLDIADVCCFNSATLSPLLHNQGRMTVVGGGSPTVVLAGGLRNDGMLEHQGGTLSVTGRLHNLGLGTLAGGIWAVNGALRHAGGDVATIDADVRLYTANSSFRGASTHDILDSFSRVTSDGRLLIAFGRGFTLNRNVVVDGRFEIANGSVLTASSGSLFGSGTVQVQGFGAMHWARSNLSATGTLHIATDGRLVMSDAGSNHTHAGRALINQGMVHWTAGAVSGGSTGGLASSITNTGLWLDDHGAANSSINHGNAQPATNGIFTNSGTYRKTGSGTTTVFAHRLDNTGRVEVQAGRLDLQMAPAQAIGNQLAGGAWEVGPGTTLAFAGVASLAVNEGDVHLRGAGFTFAPINALADNRGAFRISEGRNFTTAGNLVNSGLLFAGAGSRLTVNGSLVTTATGVLAGSGELQVGLLTAAGAITPGASPGRLHLTGGLAMQDSAALDIEIAGADAGIAYDTLHVTGPAQIAGQLRVNLLNTFAGIQGASFTILSAGSIEGQFAGLADGARFDVSGVGGSFAIDYTPTAVYLTGYLSTAPVPEPCTWVMLGAGLALLAMRMRWSGVHFKPA